MQGNENVFHITEINPFRTKSPKDILDGLGDCVVNIIIGTIGSLSTLIYSIVTGFQKRSVKGFIQGLLSGVLLSSSLSTLGTITGLLQILRGLINTPRSIKEHLDNKKMWDTEASCWKSYSINDEYEAIAGMKSFQDTIACARKRSYIGSTSQDVHPKDSTLYNRLGVHPNVSFEEIKVAYFQLALTQHPDKNPSPEATRVFQSITEAYRVLSDPKQRRIYDEQGLQAYTEANHEVTQKNANSVVYDVLGGIELQLFLGPGIPSLFFLEGIFLQPSELKCLRRIQNLSIALNTVSLAELFVEHLFPESFKQKSTENLNEFFHAVGIEAITLTDPMTFTKLEHILGRISIAPLGKQMIYFLGSCYVRIAKDFLSTQGLRSYLRYFFNFRRVKESVRSTFKLSVSSASLTKRIYAISKKIDKSDEISTRALVTEKISVLSRDIANIMWYFLITDIQKTFTSISGLLLYDISASTQKRYARSHALLALGRYLQGKGEPYDWNPQFDILSHL